MHWIPLRFISRQEHEASLEETVASQEAEVSAEAEEQAEHDAVAEAEPEAEEEGPKKRKVEAAAGIDKDTAILRLQLRDVYQLFGSISPIHHMYW